jgi:hypothetical protein
METRQFEWARIIISAGNEDRAASPVRTSGTLRLDVRDSVDPIWNYASDGAGDKEQNGNGFGKHDCDVL